MRRILFLTGTRADFGKIKPLIRAVKDEPSLDYLLVATGMHLDDRYGRTEVEITKSGFDNLVTFSNTGSDDFMDRTLARTISGLSPILIREKPDLLVVHGDRVEALAGAITGALNNVLVAHIEGGEFSGTVDELMRHAITKLSHIHYVANDSAREVVLQLGERPDSVWLIGSPEVDIMLSDSLPSPENVKSYYEIPFDQFAILAFHPITTELSELRHQVDELCEAIVLSGTNIVVVYPNNDQGSSVILERIMRLRTLPTVRLIPSLRFEAFQTLLKHARFIIGNSSSGVREAGVHGTPCINIGSRQSHRANGPNIVNTDPNRDDILRAISIVTSMPRAQSMSFGDGQSSRRFIDSLLGDQLWRTSLQKVFHRT